MIRVNGDVSSKELAHAFNVSTMTISRDLNELAKGGEINLIHGGATDKENSIVHKPMSIKDLTNINVKKSFGQYCISIITPGNSVFIVTATTTFAVAKEIFHKQDCTFFTNLLLILNSLSKY